MNAAPRAALVARLEQTYALAASGRMAEAEAALRALIEGLRAEGVAVDA